MSHNIIFSHPSLKLPLVIPVSPNNITWSYGMNTADFPTYGGEVVQILSIFFEDMTIEGDVSSYAEMENIHKWFLLYMQAASQGNHGVGSYDAEPVTFQYPHRSWTFTIYPKSLPSFKLSRDETVPSYTIQAAVLEADTELTDLITTDAQLKVYGGGDIDVFGKATAAIGYREDNPFSGPSFATFKRQSPDTNRGLGEFFGSLIPAWSSGDFKDIFPSSKPLDPFRALDQDSPKGTQNKQGKKTG